MLDLALLLHNEDSEGDFVVVFLDGLRSGLLEGLGEDEVRVNRHPISLAPLAILANRIIESRTGVLPLFESGLESSASQRGLPCQVHCCVLRLEGAVGGHEVAFSGVFEVGVGALEGAGVDEARVLPTLILVQVLDHHMMVIHMVDVILKLGIARTNF